MQLYAQLHPAAGQKQHDDARPHTAIQAALPVAAGISAHVPPEPPALAGPAGISTGAAPRDAAAAAAMGTSSGLPPAAWTAEPASSGKAGACSPAAPAPLAVPPGLLASATLMASERSATTSAAPPRACSSCSSSIKIVPMTVLLCWVRWAAVSRAVPSPAANAALASKCCCQRTLIASKQFCHHICTPSCSFCSRQKSIALGGTSPLQTGHKHTSCRCCKLEDVTCCGLL